MDKDDYNFYIFLESKGIKRISRDPIFCAFVDIANFSRDLHWTSKNGETIGLSKLIGDPVTYVYCDRVTKADAMVPLHGESIWWPRRLFFPPAPNLNLLVVQSRIIVPIKERENSKIKFKRGYLNYCMANSWKNRWKVWFNDRNIGCIKNKGKEGKYYG